MAATVKPIEAKSVHQIQSGQVIVDLCSVVKELVENGLDAGASAIEVRLKNNGIDEIEVQDNGLGIAAVNYESVALKHYTSKLSTYDDLSTLQTFGFRGEALSSLCALSRFTITTAQADEAPKGHRLEFEVSGKLKGTSVVACQKGTIATVQNLFEKLPVRRKELSKNIKREYGKVLGLLHAYACISTNVKFTVKNTVAKGKSLMVFATKSNTTTRENIANVYGAKTLSALVALQLELDFGQTLNQMGCDGANLTKVAVRGHISKPVFGEGRQTPDRQMFFVNGRPCGLPQIAKAINEVYKSFNVSQSPFIFADFQMDTNAYDVNVSPDKRSIFLHNATALTESLKTSLTKLFDEQDQTIPQSNVQSSKLPAFKQLNLQRESSSSSMQESPSIRLLDIEQSGLAITGSADTSGTEATSRPNRLLHDHFQNLASTREEPKDKMSGEEQARLIKDRNRRASKVADRLARQAEEGRGVDDYDNVNDAREQSGSDVEAVDGTANEDVHIHVRDFNARMAELQNRKHHRREESADDVLAVSQPQTALVSSLQQPENPSVVQNAFDRMRPRRLQPEVAEITIGDRTVTRIIGSPFSNHREQRTVREITPLRTKGKTASTGIFAKGLHRFSAPGTPSYDRVELERIENDSDEDKSEAEAGSSVGDEQARAKGLDNEISEDDSQGHDDAVEPHLLTGETFGSTEDDPDYIGEAEERHAEEARVAELIRLAEHAAERSKQGEKRAVQALKGGRAKDLVVSLAMEVELDLRHIKVMCEMHRSIVKIAQQEVKPTHDIVDETVDLAEERLSLIVSKSDFLKMHIVGQFNLGFIIAVRHKHTETAKTGSIDKDELFIIDQHASDEKYNFERLQAETVVGNQRLVRPATLDLTAVEEEIVIDNTIALEKNGFIVDVDTSGEQEVGKRCQLVSLPLSKEVILDSRDLDELLHLLAESPMLNETSPVPRPSRVRKMFAMRACRSSIMIGKTLSRKQMSTVLQHMGSIDKPWNCPHGRPTMRHLASLDTLEAALWKEGDGVYPGENPRPQGSKSASVIWKNYTG